MQTALNLERMAGNMIFTKMLKLVGVSLVSVILLLPASALAASVNLRWTANTEPDIAFYNVYCGDASRSYGNPIPVGNVTSYRVDGLIEGQTYYFAVTAEDTSGNESGFSIERSAQATTSQPSSVALAASMGNPQVEGVTVRFSASASGGSGNYEYRFYENGPHTNGNWVTVQDYSSSNTFDWNTAGKAGQSIIVVWCRNTGTQPDSASTPYAGRYFTVSQVGSAPQPNSVTLNASSGSPQDVGTTVRFTASASGGSGNYEYRFWENGPHTNGNWIVARDYASSNTFDWNTAGKVGQSVIVVWCRNAGTQPDSASIADAGRYFTVNQVTSEPQPDSVSLRENISSPVREATTVSFAATASGGSGNYEYRFWVNGPHTNGNWVIAQDYSSSRRFNWDTTGKVGQSVIVVWCRNAGTQPDSASIADAGRYFTVY
jgi:hypothetical protein